MKTVHIPFTRTVTETIDIQIPDGYEWTGEVRKPVKGDLYIFHCPRFKSLNKNGKVAVAVDGNFDYEYPIVRKTWTAPACFPKGSWLYRDFCGTWFVSDQIPKRTGNSYERSTIHFSCQADALCKLVGGKGEVFVPPTDTYCIQIV
jgi:hypothetical protein